MSISLIINGQQKVVSTKELSYDQIGRLAFDPVPTALTITYRHGPEANPEGSLLTNEIVKVKDGMIFNAAITGNS